MRCIPVHQAIGHVLAYDVTRVAPGMNKGPAFKKGCVIKEQDIETFLDMGKAHIDGLKSFSNQIHEDAAAGRIAAAAAGPGLKLAAPSEGCVNLISEYSGLFKVNVSALTQLNAIQNVVLATLHGNHRVEAGQPVAGIRVIPLVISENLVAKAERLCQSHHPLITIKPFKSLRVGMIITGSDIFLGRIKDQFGPVVRRTIETLGSRILHQIYVPDDVDKMVAGIRSLIEEGAQMVVLTGGMSVGPDDRATAGIRSAGAKVISYGASTFLGAMFMLAYIDDVPVLGFPGSVMYHHTSIFDLVVPRLLSGERLLNTDIAGSGHDGFCAGSKDAAIRWVDSAKCDGFDGLKDF
jgi:molybdopterin biosynthesis enzyme